MLYTYNGVGDFMNKRQRVLILVFLVFFFALTVMGEQITNGIINHAYKPYKGVVVALDAGHGGKDDGARREGVKEQELNLAITKKLKEALETLGMKVILTRQDENDLAGQDVKNRKRADMKARTDIINQKKVDFFISIHMNAYADNSVQGSQIFYDKKDEDSYLFASFIQEATKKVTKTKMEVKTGDYYILKNSNKIGILLECGFLSNAHERSLLQDEKYQNKFVNAIKIGIMDFMEEVYE